MNLYIINEVLCDYTTGMCVIAAESMPRCEQVFMAEFAPGESAYIKECMQKEFNEAPIKLYESNQKRFKLGIVGHLITAGFIGVLVFYGHILLATLYLITVVLSYGMVEKGKKLVEGANS